MTDAREDLEIAKEFIRLGEKSSLTLSVKTVADLLSKLVKRVEDAEALAQSLKGRLDGHTECYRCEGDGVEPKIGTRDLGKGVQK